MARPNTKEELILSANLEFKTMFDLIDGMDSLMQTDNFNYGDKIGKEAHWKRDKNIKDLLVHLYEWHNLMLNWVNSNMKGNALPFLPEPYNWKTYGDMNVEFFNKHKSTPYNDARAMIISSHEKVLSLLEGFSNEELFTKKYFSFTGTSSLGQYFISSLSSHYDWAIKKIKLHIKTYK